eukprot:TRINITY_DN9383_c0_g1_i3.p1 TRINITY_DN9383_c0_g1~~TRINITY_DN9383_c0_g1_i3.p1  ORF type:complete len:121 (-),score=22.95 TRINITY_DN9383_c0_g1_i3:39-401(-)
MCIRDRYMGMGIQEKEISLLKQKVHLYNQNVSPLTRHMTTHNILNDHSPNQQTNKEAGLDGRGRLISPRFAEECHQGQQQTFNKLTNFMSDGRGDENIFSKSARKASLKRTNSQLKKNMY